MTNQRIVWAFIVGIAPCAGFASDAPPPLTTTIESDATSLPVARSVLSPHKNPFGSLALSDHALARLSGGTDSGPVSEMKLRGVVSDTSAVNVSTGNNLISEGALANASGIPMVIQNSGNNVLIQSATIVNIQIK